MKSRRNITLSIVNAPLLRAPRLVLTSAVLLLVVSSQATGFADSATWRMNPVNGDWNTAANWTTGGPPNGPSDTATFASSNTASVSLSNDTLVNGIVFNSGASVFAITVTLRLSLSFDGAGITNNSGITQEFLVGGASGNLDFGLISFDSSAAAGTGTEFALMGGTDNGRVYFHSNSSAASGTFTLAPPSAPT